MSIRLRHVNNFWNPRAMARQALRLVPPAPRLIGPQPYYPLGKPQPNVSLLPTNHSEPARKRMDKLTGVERDLLSSVKVSLEIGKAHGHYGYVLKLVKRGYFKQVSVRGRVYTFAPTPEGERARANLNLRAEAGAVLKKAEQRQLRALTSYNSMRTVTA